MIAGAVAAEVEAARGEFDDDVLCEEAAAPRLMIYFFLTLVLTNNYILLLCGLMNVSSQSLVDFSLSSLSLWKNSLVQKHKFFRHHKNKSSSPIIVDNMSAIAQSAISFGTFPPSYPTFRERQRQKRVCLSRVLVRRPSLSSLSFVLLFLFLLVFVVGSVGDEERRGEM